MKYLVLLSITFLLFSFSNTIANDFKEGKVIVSGKVKLRPSSSKVITLIYSNIVERNYRRSLVLDSSGSFQYDIPLLNPQDLILQYEGNKFPLFGSPLDSIHIEIDAQNPISIGDLTYKVSGKGAEVSEYLRKYESFKYVKPFQPKVEGKSVQEYHADLEKHINSEKEQLLDFVQKFAPSKAFIDWAEYDILYKNANYLVNYSAYGRGDKKDLYQTRLFPKDNDLASIHSYYWIHLNQFAYFQYAALDPQVQELRSEGDRIGSTSLLLKNLVTNEKEGLSRDIMMVSILAYELSKSSEVFETLWRDNKSNIANLTLRNKLEGKYLRSIELATESASFWNTKSSDKEISSDNFFSELRQKHPGKVIYLDFWAVWCGPCNNEAPSAYELHEYFKDKDVVFVNLCFESNRSQWEKAIKNMNLQGENYHFEDDESKLVQSAVGISGFPTYMLIDKDGNLVSKNAARPSSGKVIKQDIEKLLNQ